MPESMGLQFGLHKGDMIFKRKHRWLFKIPDVSAEGTQALPPMKAARPSLSFKEIEIQHITETIYYPGKPEWKTINLFLYDLGCRQESPVMAWLKRLYSPQNADYGFLINGENDEDNLKLDATLEMYDGCGNCMEKWVLDNCYPQQVDFEELDMSSVDVLLAEITLRYDRAYILECDGQATGDEDDDGEEEVSSAKIVNRNSLLRNLF